MSCPVRRALSGLVLSLLIAAVAAAEAPRIANIFPDFPVSYRPRGRVPCVVTGENFRGEDLVVRCWDPKADEQEIAAAAEALGDDAPALPDEPPKDARTIRPIDVERQVLVTHLTGVAAWVQNAEGVSRPCPINLPQPWWISHETAEPGSRLHICGRALRRDHGGPRTYAPKPLPKVAFRQGDRTYLVTPERDPRATVWTDDSRLIYFRAPRELRPGKCTLWVHNGLGGTYGWVKAGEIEIVAPKQDEPQVFSVADHGATGDDLTDDTEAIEQALTTAAEAGGGIVFLPNGLYRVRRTIVVPSGVTLRGAGRDAAVIEGFSGGEGGGIASVTALRTGSTIEKLAVQGHVNEGTGGNCLVSLVPDENAETVEGVSILGCRLRALPEDDRMQRVLYWGAMRFGRARRLNMVRNDIYGSIWFNRADRFELIGNTFHNGTFSINVSIHGWAYDSLMDDNLFVDTPGRVCFYPKRHTYVRFNEVHHAGRAAWANASEVFLVHGLYDRGKRTVGTATGGTETTLTDAAQVWSPGAMRETTVLILAGRGFGQYRQVVDNTADTLTVDEPWRVAPDETSEYLVSPLYVENAFYNNVNNTPMVMSLWLDCVANEVVRHRDVWSSGITLWSGDDSRAGDGGGENVNRFMPSYYNLIANSWLDGSQITTSVGGDAKNLRAGPPMFANMVLANRVRSPHMHRTGKDRQAWGNGGVRIGGIPQAGKAPPQGRVGASHAVVAYNQFAFTNIGVVVGGKARKTFVLGNDYQAVEHPILDWGARTRFAGNSELVIGPEGKATRPIEDFVSEREIRSTRPLTLRSFDRADGLVATLRVPVTNDGDAPATYALTWRRPEGSPWTPDRPRREVTVPPGRRKMVKVRLRFEGEPGGPPPEPTELLPLPELVIRPQGADNEADADVRPLTLDARAYLTTARPMSAVCPELPAAPTIDGTADESAWDKADPLSSFVTSGGGSDVRAATNARIGRHDGTLYLVVTCREPSGLGRLRTAAEQRDGPVYRDDCIELFIDADHDRETYHQLVANAAGTRFDMRSAEGASWNGAWRVAARRDADEKTWTLEFAVPFDTLGVKATAGLRMGLNLVRFRPPRERTMWSPVFSTTNHVPVRFGTLVLE